MSATGNWSVLNGLPVSSNSNHIIYDQTVLGIDYLDGSNQTLSIINFKIKDHNGRIVNLNDHDVSFSIIFVKTADK